jgi:hypothetical protein
MGGVKSLEVEGSAVDAAGGIELVDDGKRRTVRVVLG